MEVEVNLTQLWIIISVVICSLTEQTCGEWHYLFIFLIMHLEVSVLAYIWIFCWLRYSYVGLLLYDIRWWLCVWFPTLADRAGIHVLGSHRHLNECRLIWVFCAAIYQWSDVNVGFFPVINPICQMVTVDMLRTFIVFSSGTCASIVWYNIPCCDADPVVWRYRWTNQAIIHREHGSWVAFSVMLVGHLSFYFEQIGFES